MIISDKAHSFGEFLAKDYGNGREVYTKCLKFALWLVKNPDDAGELVREAYFRVIRGGERYKYPIPVTSGRTEESRRIRNYLCKIIENLNLDIMKKRKRRESHFSTLERRLIREQIQPEEIVVCEETKRVVRESVLNLPARSREVVFMYYFFGMTKEEIAKNIGRSEGTVDIRLKEAIELLVERFGTKYPDMMVA